MNCAKEKRTSCTSMKLHNNKHYVRVLYSIICYNMLGGHKRSTVFQYFNEKGLYHPALHANQYIPPRTQVVAPVNPFYSLKTLLHTMVCMVHTKTVCYLFNSSSKYRSICTICWWQSVKSQESQDFKGPMGSSTTVPKGMASSKFGMASPGK